MGRLLVQRLHPAAKTPTVAHAGEDLGYDIFALEDTFLEPHKPTIVKTGIAAVYVATQTLFPLGSLTGQEPQERLNFKGRRFGLEIKDRSSMAAKNHLHTLAGVIDAGYRGEIGVVMVLLGIGQQFSPEHLAGIEKFGWSEGLIATTLAELRTTPAYKNPGFALGYQIKAGDKIAQLLPREVYTDTVELVETLPEFGSRGASGYGSTGK